MPNRNNQDQPVYFTTQQAANQLGVHVRTLYRWEDNGLISPRRTPGGHRRYSRDDVEALLERRSA